MRYNDNTEMIIAILSFGGLIFLVRNQVYHLLEHGSLPFDMAYSAAAKGPFFNSGYEVVFVILLVSFTFTFGPILKRWIKKNRKTKK